MLRTIPEITFVQAMPNDLVHQKYFDSNIPSLAAFDGLMRIVINDNTTADLFTEGRHHHSVLFII